MFKRNLILTLAGAALLLPLAGCGNNDLVKEDPKEAAARLNASTDLRSYFDKVGGNFDSLSPEDKQAVIKVTGSEKNARDAFAHMVPSRPGTSTGGGLPPSGPSGM